MTPDEIASLEEDLTAINSNAFAREILGVTEGASSEEIRRAYHASVQLWHPDRLSGMAPELQALANERLAQLNEAYSDLRGNMA